MSKYKLAAMQLSSIFTGTSVNQVSSMVYIPQHGMSEYVLRHDWNVFVWSSERFAWVGSH